MKYIKPLRETKCFVGI